MIWCREHSLDCLPVAFPRSSWHNLKSASPLNQITQLKGKFLWSQLVAAKRAGAGMVYVARFDEIAEGTAISKCSNQPPGGADPFVTDDGCPATIASGSPAKARGCCADSCRCKICYPSALPEK